MIVRVFDDNDWATYWPFPTELPKPLPAKPIPINPDNYEDAPW